MMLDDNSNKKMSDWNTLHLFDSKRFYKKIAPELKNNGQLIETYIKSKLYWYTTRVDQFEEELLQKIKNFTTNFDHSFRVHLELYELETQKKKVDEKYDSFIQQKQENIRNFEKKYSDEIYYYSCLLPLIMFSECAQFNPHLILGRRIFDRNISTKENSIADECCAKITDTEIGGLGNNDIGRIINWLTDEEVKLLWLDMENVYPRDKESEQYFNDFKGFLKIAVQNELGLISSHNVNETVLNLIETPQLNIKIDLKKMNFVSVIESK